MSELVTHAYLAPDPPNRFTFAIVTCCYSCAICDPESSAADQHSHPYSHTHIQPVTESEPDLAD